MNILITFSQKCIYHISFAYNIAIGREKNHYSLKGCVTPRRAQGVDGKISLRAPLK